MKVGVNGAWQENRLSMPSLVLVGVTAYAALGGFVFDSTSA